MVNKRSVTLKEKIMYGVLTAVAGTLTVIAFMCVLLSSVAPSFCTDLFPVHTSSVGSLKDNIKVENTAVPMGSVIDNSHNSSTKAGNGSVNGNTGSGSAVNNANGDSSTSSSGGTDSSSAGTGGSGTASVSTGSSGGTDSSSSTGASNGSSSTGRTQSTCFGGEGHCYAGY
jgi:hypothetical protein